MVPAVLPERLDSASRRRAQLVATQPRLILRGEGYLVGLLAPPISAECCPLARRRCPGVPGCLVTVLAVRLFYVDDSGNETVTTFSAVSVPVQAWTAALDSWLSWRRHLHSTHRIDVQSRLHAADWLAGVASREPGDLRLRA
jgi:hypothetical protein